MKITAEHTFVVGDVINVQWQAELLFSQNPTAEPMPMRLKDGLMAAQVTTFDAAALKMKH